MYILFKVSTVGLFSVMKPGNTDRITLWYVIFKSRYLHPKFEELPISETVLLIFRNIEKEFSNFVIQKFQAPDGQDWDLESIEGGGGRGVKKISSRAEDKKHFPNFLYVNV